MVSGCVGLLPLLFTPQGKPVSENSLTLENLLKITYLVLFFTVLFPYLGKPDIFEKVYYVGLSAAVAIEELAPLIAYTGLDGGMLTKYEFLPLMGISVACATGIIWGWLRFLRIMITD
jgi:ALG6, ALG8 glycosyltransferase family